MIFLTLTLILIVSAIFILLLTPTIRRSLLVKPLMQWIRSQQLLPAISATERAAIEAGTVWIEREFFSGKPDVKRLLTEPYPDLPEPVQAFLAGPVERVCQMATDWEIYQQKDLPEAVWDYLKQERFFGMMIPPEFGGLGFSHQAYSAVMVKLASRSFVHTATVGVTNSLGPAKLLLAYGTPEQQAFYLPRLARGEEIPCFALTEPGAGSDAASLQAEGVVFRGPEGELLLRLNFAKRYITLGAIATLIGLAVRLRDPEQLLGLGEAVGITCILVPGDAPGLVRGRRHDPMGVPFYNSPLEGRDVVVPVGQIIGGPTQAGQGWKMLMQCLAAGRGISFPASCTGVAKFVARGVGAYAGVRRQFGLTIGRFAGVEEPLARIAGWTYVLEAARIYTAAAVDAGERPSVTAAIAKYEFTELTRRMLLDGMDVLGGAGICRGPRNLLSHLYSAMPIPITVEGANILTRTLMIYGQGAIRCHPYVYDEIQALETGDVVVFDRLLWQHAGLILRNTLRAKVLSWTRGRFVRSPLTGPMVRYGQKLVWATAVFACLSDWALLSLGGSLKRQEQLTGRFADMLAWLYLATATLRRYEAEGRPPADLPLVHWALQHAFAQIQTALEGLLANWPGALGILLRGPAFAWFRLSPLGMPPSDRLGSQVAQLLQTPGAVRDRLTTGIHVPTAPDEAIARLDRALQLTVAAEPDYRSLKAAMRSGQLPEAPLETLIPAAQALDLLSAEQAERLRAAELARWEAIQVDSFAIDPIGARAGNR